MKHLGRKSVDSKLAEALERIAGLEQEIAIKNEQRARYDDRVIALRRALTAGLDSSEARAREIARFALAVDDKTAADMPE